MSHEFFTLEQASRHVHLPMNELKHVAQRGEIEACLRGGEWFFEHAALDEWAQRHLLSTRPRDLLEQHRSILETRRREKKSKLGVADYFCETAIDLDLAAKAKSGVLRDMTDLAEKSMLVYDPDLLFRELVAREEIASTAVGCGAAFLHPRFHDPYLFQETFIAYARSNRTIFFGAPDGGGTRHFFLICSNDHELHLHLLARLAVLAHGTDLMEQLDVVENEADVVKIVAAAEAPYLNA